MLELRCARDEQAVEKGTGVDRGDGGMVATSHRVDELPDVTRQAVGVDPDVAAGHEQVVTPERSARIVQRLRQRVTRTVGIHLGPEQSKKPVATHPTLTCRREHAEQREQTPLRRGTAECRAIAGDECAAEGVKLQHDRPSRLR